VKSLYLKQKIHIGGPWTSFEFDKVTPDYILSKFYGKAGHPFQMILLLHMDCFIIEETQIMPWMREIKHLFTTVQKNTTNTKHIKDIDFNKYDFVLSEDPIIDAKIIKQYPDTLFSYSCAEHFDSKYSNAYDLFLQHIDNQPQRHPNEIFFTFPRDAYIMQKMFDVTNKTGYYIDNRDKERHSLDLINHNTSPVSKTSYYCPINIIEGESKQYYENLAKSKYAIGLHPRHGQFFHDAASLNCVCIGQTKNKNKYFLHPDMICDNIACVKNKIKMLEKNQDYYQSVITWQLHNIKDLSQKFVSTVQKEIEKKRQIK